MFYDDDIGGGFFENSLESLEKQSARQAETVLRGVEDLLHAAGGESEIEGGEEREQVQGPTDVSADEGGLQGGAHGSDDDGGAEMEVQRFDYERHCGVGYNAHHDGVDAEELLAWRKQFTYLRVAPSAVFEFEDDDANIDQCGNPSDATCMSPCEAPFGSGDVDELNLLCVVGRRAMMQLAPAITAAADSIEEVIAQDGNLEEMIEYDVVIADQGNEAASTAVDGNADRSVSPSVSMQEEVVSSILDALWPDVVIQLTPLIKRIANLPPEAIKPSPKVSAGYGYGDSEW